MRRMVTVIHPNYNPQKHGDIKLSDYITVPHLDTIGGWRMKDMLSFREIKMLADLANALERQAQRAPRTGIRKEQVRWRA